MQRIGLVQLDSVNVCIRSHYMPFYSRLGPYDRDGLDAWINTSGELFEYWAHEAAVLPVEQYPLWRWKMDTMEPWRRAESVLDGHPGLLEDVLAQVRERGPLTVRDLEAPAYRTEAWWGYGPGKVALEVLFANGHLSALRTANFTRLYDLVERTIPPEIFDDHTVERDEAYRRLLRQAVRHHGIGTVHDIADYFRLHVPTSRAILAGLAREDAIEEVVVPGWKAPVYLDPAVVRPHRIDGAVLLSPFDPMVWYRERAERLFGFRYRIEIYVPEADRVFGYYVLPFMVDGEFAGRVDLKADRASNRLLVRSAFSEEGRSTAHDVEALASELETFATWLGLSEIEIGAKGNLSSVLARRM